MTATHHAPTTPASREPVASRWQLALYGAASLISGAVLVARPALSLVALVQVLAVFWLVTGVLTLADAVRAMRAGAAWGAALAQGLLATLAGVAIMVYPIAGALVTELTVAYASATFAVLAGILGLRAGWRRRGREGAWRHSIAGALSCLFGVAVFAAPLLAGVAYVIALGLAGLVGGGCLIAAALLGGRQDGASARSGSRAVGELAG